MTKINHTNERIIKRIATFMGLVILTLLAFYLLSSWIRPVNDEGMLVVISIVISLQISFLTAFLLTNTNTK
jgi:hypothetical protein